MNIVELKLVTIIGEPVLGPKIIALVQSLGAKGFTLTEVRGEGSSHRHASDQPDSRIKIEVIASKELASRIMSVVSDVLFKDFSLIVYSVDAMGMRETKF